MNPFYFSQIHFSPFQSIETPLPFESVGDVVFCPVYHRQEVVFACINTPPTDFMVTKFAIQHILWFILCSLG